MYMSKDSALTVHIRRTQVASQQICSNSSNSDIFFSFLIVIIQSFGFQINLLWLILKRREL